MKPYLPRKQDGFTLLEVLIALLILSVGLIGLAGLQVAGVTNVRDSYYRTQALMLSYDIADRMRANIDAVTGGNYAGITGAQVDACRTSNGCTSAQLASDDVYWWRQASSALPGGDAIVCIDSSPDDGTSSAAASCDNAGSQYVSKIWWDDDRNPATPDQRLVAVFVP